MKQSRNFRLGIGIGLGILVAGLIVIFGTPYIDKHASFLLGFIVCLVIGAFVLLVAFARYQNSFVTRWFGNRSRTEESGSTSRMNVDNWIPVSVFIVLVGLVSAFFIFKQNELVKSRVEYQKTRIIQESERIESIRISGLVYLIGNVMDKIDDELENSPNRILSDETIARVAGLCYSFKPYTLFEGDSFSTKKLSPERGQLLIALSKMSIDTGSMDKIMFQASFLGADLREADLRDADLRGIDLREAQLQGANLQGAKLNKADLRATNLWGANLSNADLSGADLKRADLRWADMNGADLKRAVFNGADMTSAKLRKADLRGTVVQYAELGGVFLNEANLAGANFHGTNLERAHFTKANMSETFLRTANLKDANLREANLNGANLIKANLIGAELNNANLTGADLTEAVVLEENWLIMLNEWLVTGAKDIQKQYKIADDISYEQNGYQLEKIED